MTSPKAPPMRASKRIASNTFDPDAIADSAALYCIRMDLYCELNNIGVRFVPMRRGVSLREVKPFGLIEAESDPFVGKLIRHLRQEGWLSDKREVIERLEYETLKQHNSAHRKHLDRTRNLHSVVGAEIMNRLDQTERKRARLIAIRGQRWLDGTAPMMPVERRQNVLADLADLAPEEGPKRTRGPKSVKA